MDINVNIQINKDITTGSLYLIPSFIKCRYCGHEIPIGLKEIRGMIDCNGGCKKRSSVVDYAKYFGVIKNLT